MAIKCLNQDIGCRHALYNGDSCEVFHSLPEKSIGLSVFSPPFTDLYCYSDNERDLGNCRTPELFFNMFGTIVDALLKAIMPGRIVAVHCMDLPSMKERDGVIGLKDFPGDIIRCFQDRGFIYHSRVAIWKDPLIEATRTKAIGLMHKQLCKDSSMCRMGLPDYVLAFRAPGENAAPISQGEGMTSYAGANDPGGSGLRRSHNIWRAYASPVWMDIRQSHTLNKTAAREESDEKHICPLQLDVIERCITLWSNPGDVVATPFMGIGSEVFQALRMGRRAIGCELKESYFRQAVRNAHAAMNMDAGFVEDLFRAEGEQSA
jgi:hypothetical protein